MGDHTLLLCDEPTGNLDSVNTEAVLALFDRLGDAGLTLVLVTHEDQVAAHARRRVRMIDGRLTEEERGGGERTGREPDRGGRMRRARPGRRGGRRPHGPARPASR